MADHSNADILRDLVDALNSNDAARMAEYIHDDIVWHYIGGSEPIRGKAAMAESLSPSSGDFTITAEVHDALATDDHIVALVNAHAVRGDKTLDYRTAEICHIRDGKIAERWAFSDDTARIADFFA